MKIKNAIKAILNDKKIATFEIEIDRKKTKFNIYGLYSIKKNHDGKKYPEFSDLAAYVVSDENGDEVYYTPEGKNWAGVTYTVEDMIQQCLMDLSQMGSTFCNVVLDEQLQKMINEYLQDAILIGEKAIPKCIFGEMMNRYELFMVTNKYIYYIHDDSLQMYDYETRNKISDNYFAEIGYIDSVDAIKSGEETLILGELPEQKND